MKVLCDYLSPFEYKPSVRAAVRKRLKEDAREHGLCVIGFREEALEGKTGWIRVVAECEPMALDYVI